MEDLSMTVLTATPVHQQMCAASSAAEIRFANSALPHPVQHSVLYIRKKSASAYLSLLMFAMVAVSVEIVLWRNVFI
jgi:ABC-type siderophore export system fused ATPase/permease subunit